MWAGSRRLTKYCAAGALALGGLTTLAITDEIENIGLVRFGRAAKTAFSIGFLYKVNLYWTDLSSSSEEYRDLKSKVHQMSAQKLLDLCCSNKGVFVKVGQHLGALNYLLPTEYTDTLKVLHQRAPCSPLSEIYSVIREDLKQEPLELFTHFDPEPLGTASLAQVHKAVLKDGRTVAVKVQHPYVQKNSMVDMRTMEVLVEIASWVFPEFEFKWLVRETKKNIPVELNFKHEAENIHKVKQLFSRFPWLKIPDVYNELSTERVLVMEYVEGGNVNDLDYMKQNMIDPFEVSDKLGKLYSDMIFRKGFVHSDPHPGNILVKRQSNGSADIVLLDHGLYAVVSDYVRQEYAGLWMSILNKDQRGIHNHCEALGVGNFSDFFASMVTARSKQAIEKGIVVTKYTQQEKELFQRSIPMILSQITKTLSLVNKEMLLILKTNDLLRGIEYTLKTENRMSSFLIMSRHCIQCIYEEKMKKMSSRQSKLMLYAKEQWILIKITFYYFYLSVKTLSLRSALRSFMFD